MAYRVRASEMASASSGRLRWGDLQSEIAASFTDALTPPSELATKRLRDAVCSQLSDHPILHAAPSIQVDDSVRAPWTDYRPYRQPRPSLLATVAAPAGSRGPGSIRTGSA
ncbi:MAG: hypothetical protein HW385_521 [candidate division NC10 bacterium]|nr:hypothetical protein [candidate division NC10 bacterium]